MGLCDDVRASCAAIAASAEHVRIDESLIGAIEPGPEPALDSERHYLEGSREDVATYLLTLDTINFGSGWFPTLEKRPGCSGYFTVAWNLADQFRAHGPWSPEELSRLDAAAVARVMGQEEKHQLMKLFSMALQELGEFLSGRTALDVVAEAGGSAEALAESLVAGMPFYDDIDFWKRAQIVPADLALAGIAEFEDLDRLTIFADNLVPHVLRMDGVLVYSDELAEIVDGEQLLDPGEEEREIRACAVHACELIAAGMGVAAHTLDNWLWNRGQQPHYKARPRHRCQTVNY
jgi:hypothetical protein